MTLSRYIHTTIVRLAASILAKEARAQQARKAHIHDQLRAELDAGYVGGVKVR